MNSYRNYEVEDFVCDDFFIEWVLNPQEETSAFWDNWQQENPEKVMRVQNARAILLAIRVKDNNKHLSDNDLSNIDDYVRKHAIDLKHDNVVPIERKLYNWLKIAASITVLFVLAISYQYFKRKPNVSHNNSPSSVTTETNLTRIKNRSKEGLVVKLADGSVVVLCPNSNLAYPKNFSGLVREVTLEGKGFFEVKKNPAIPFIVHTKYITTKVLGTSFVVDASANKESRVVVFTGKVVVNRNDDPKESNWVTLTPNKQVAYAPTTEKMKTDTVMAHPALAADMAHNEFVFKATPFFDIIQKVEGAYNITIDYDEEKYGKTSVTGDISKLSLDEKIKFICKAVNADYHIEGGRIRIY